MRKGIYYNKRDMSIELAAFKHKSEHIGFYSCI